MPQSNRVPKVGSVCGRTITAGVPFGFLRRFAGLLFVPFTACGGGPFDPPPQASGWTQWSRICGVYTNSAVYCLRTITGSAFEVQEVSSQFKAVEIATGLSHSCIITPQQFLACWGSNKFGQLGDGTTSDATALVPISIDEKVQQVSVGPHHTCATTTDGKLYCWGANGSGQLGVPASDQCAATSCSTNPIRVPFNQRILMVVAAGSDRPGADGSGVGFTCAIDAAHTAFCWGANEMGQLGVGSRTEHMAPVSVGLSEVHHIAAGANHTCVLQGQNRDVYCWGSNLRGQLAVPSNEANTCSFGDVHFPCFTSPQRTPITGLSIISAFEESTCGIDVNNTGLCWGSNQFKQLGSIAAVGQFSRFPQSVAPGRKVREIAPAGSLICAMFIDGTAACRGNGFDDLIAVMPPPSGTN